MKTVAAFILTLAAVRGSFAQTLTLPECGATCMVSSVTVTSCSASDLECLCTNSKYISVAVNCINDSCDATDAQNAYAYATYSCASVGVTVPSVSSVLNAPAPAPAPAPKAAPAPAPAPAAAPKAADPPASAPAPAPAAGGSDPTSSDPPTPATTTTDWTSSTASTTQTGNSYVTPMVTFEGSSANIVGIEKRFLTVVALIAAALLGAGML